MAFIETFRNYCGGNRALAYLLIAVGASGLLCSLYTFVASAAGFNPGLINEVFALSADPITALCHPWTPITYMAVHYSLLHLLFNLLWLYWFGRMLADIESERTILTLFLGGGITGGILYVIFSAMTASSGSSYLTGDSAAVLSVMSASGLMMPDRRLRLMLIGEVKLKWIASGCILLTLLGGATGGLPVQTAHIGGVIFGCLFALDRKQILNFRFRKKSKKSAPSIRSRATAKAMKKLSDHERLDQLLDKIRLSGYDSLSEREKTELNHISSRIGEQSETDTVKK